jgi:hypothetical protein
MTDSSVARQGVAREGPLPGGSSSPENAAVDRPAKILLATALVLGLLRFFRLGEWSLWLDEALTLADYSHGLDDGQIGNPIGYHLIAAYNELLGGVPDEASLRFLPALFGWATIGLTYWAFRPVAGARCSAAASLLVSLSTWHMFWSQTARFYTMAQAITLIGSGLVVRSIFMAGSARAGSAQYGSVREDSTRRRVILCSAGTLIVASAALFHASSVLIVPALLIAPWIPVAMGLELPARTVKVLAALTVVLGVVALLGVPWALNIWRVYDWNKPAGSPMHFVLTTGFHLTPLLGAGALVGTLRSFVRRDSFGVFASSVAILVICAGFVASLLVVVTAQYVFMVLPWVALLASLPLRVSPERRLFRWGYLVILALPAIASLGLYFGAHHGARSRWREAYEYVWNEKGPDDLVMGQAAPVGEFYVSPRSTHLRSPVEVAWIEKSRAAVKIPQQWARQPRRIWFVVREEWLKGFAPEDRASFERMLREECRLVKHFPLWLATRDLSLYVYVRD